jgi:hypothetical protein
MGLNNNVVDILFIFIIGGHRSNPRRPQHPNGNAIVTARRRSVVEETVMRSHDPASQREGAWLRLLLRTGFKPFAPQPRSAIGISASIIVERADKCDPVLYVRRLPVPRPSRMQHIVVVSQ